MYGGGALYVAFLCSSYKTIPKGQNPIFKNN